MKEELLFIESTGVRADSESTFNVIKDFYDYHQLDMRRCFDNTSDGSPTMFGARNGVNVRSKLTYFIYKPLIIKMVIFVYFYYFFR